MEQLADRLAEIDPSQEIPDQSLDLRFLNALSPGYEHEQRTLRVFQTSAESSTWSVRLQKANSESTDGVRALFAWSDGTSSRGRSRGKEGNKRGGCNRGGVATAKAAATEQRQQRGQQQQYWSWWSLSSLVVHLLRFQQARTPCKVVPYIATRQLRRRGHDMWDCPLLTPKHVSTSRVR